MAAPKESEDHREWREDLQTRIARFGRVQDVAERMAIETPDLSPEDCVSRAQKLYSALQTLYPWPGREPPYSDESDEGPPTEPPPPTVADVLVLTPPTAQPAPLGFWPNVR